MDISSIQGRSKKISLEDFFTAEDFFTVKYIPREKWKLINKLVLKSDDVLLVTKYQEIFGHLEKSEIEIEAMTLEDRLNYYDKKNQNFVKTSQMIPEAELIEAQRIGEKVNRMLVEFGLDADNHTFTTGGKKVKLDFTVAESLGAVKNATGNDLYLFILESIRNYNNEFELGEQIGRK